MKARCVAGFYLLWMAFATAGISQPTAASVHERSKGNARAHVPLGDFVIQSHRGAGVLAPENTLGAFELGWKLGTVPESDLRTTRDGVIVAFHDPDFSRVVKSASPELQKKGVKDITFAELEKLDVGSWEGKQFEGRHVSKMTEVFALMTGKPERRLYLDIKNVDLKQLAGEVRDAQVEKQVILASTHYPVICEWKKLIPEGQTLLWMGGPEKQLKKRIAALRAANFDGVTQLQIHIYLNTNSASAGPFTLSRQFLKSTGEEVRSHGILYQALPYNTTDPKVDWQLLDLGFDSFATDHPKLTLKAVRDYYAGKNR
jgi:glycerophosphoryl diester phosphodiesterase